MEVVNERAAMISNYEVFNLLQEKMQEDLARRQHKRKKQENLATIFYEVVKYLEKTACKLQNGVVIREFLHEIAPFNLTKGEKLQMLNLRPSTPVEIQLLIEESEERLKTDEELEKVLEIVSKLPVEEKEADKNDENMEEEGN